ncbi:glycosyltransferase family 2 protein [Nocardioides dilutus]
MSAFATTRRRHTRRPRVSIVIPALNDAANLAMLLPRLPKVHEVILVDGGSVDGTIATARRLVPDVVAVLQARTGKGNALASGLARVSGDVVVVLDADHSGHPAEIALLVSALVDGADVAKGSRFIPGGAPADLLAGRTFGDRAINAGANLAFHARFTDLRYGFTAFWSDLIPVLALPDHTAPPTSNRRIPWGDGAEVETLISCRLAAAGLDIVEVPSVDLPGRYVESGPAALRDGLRLFRTLLVEAWRARSARRHSGRGHHGLGDLPAALEHVRETAAAEQVTRERGAA